MYEYLDEEDDEEEVLLCLRGYPFTCPVKLPFEIEDIEDPDVLCTLNEIARALAS